jgi:hypothetical protein
MTTEGEFLGSREEDFLNSEEAVLMAPVGVVVSAGADCVAEVDWILGMVWLWGSRLLSLKNLWRMLHRLLV